MAFYRRFKVHEVGTDTYIDYEANVSCTLPFTQIRKSIYSTV